ncbi:MAG: hypothetical protein COB16_11680 [Rhodobacteraceae bacterium]|nr:MAG: hypothetical protein COB16_11350 [Paracoccaceae bacterium]PCJ07335.1 MAG: hypothetical protein COB16_11680 [Paracoccaceae bacterium]
MFFTAGQVLDMKDLFPSPIASKRWRASDDFLRSVARWPDRPAITVAGRSYSYSDLNTHVQALAAAIADCENSSDAPVAAIYANRSLETYVAVLAAGMRGYAYVPLNSKFPAERNRYILDRSGASVLIFDQNSGAAVADILTSDSDAPTAPLPHQILSSNVPTSTRRDLPRLHDNPYAYVLFTSGSTGQPKGVAIRHSNLEAYLQATFAVTDYNHQDRMSQNFDLTFDLSAHDMFVCWRAGGHLIVPSAADLERPADYLHSHNITCWFSVPSLAQKMRLQGAVQPGSLSNLRLTLFCGEALPVDLAQDWARATGQRVENWYGPTEATIACTRYQLPADPEQIQGRFNLVPIGIPLPGVQTLVLKEDGSPAAAGDSGELLVTGPQVADGYVGDADKTAKAFVLPTGRSAIHYRTGDRVETEEDGNLQFIDRIDNQIKIRGYRVELGEIEAVLRSHAAGCNAVVVALPLKSAIPTSLVGVVEGWEGPGRQLKQAIEGHLPDYMTPSRVLVMKHFPKNASGKVDRGAIGQRVVSRLEKMHAAATPKKKFKRQDRLVQFIQQINPAIARQDIERAENLMDAGLDSMGFVDFTIRLENHFDLSLTQETVSELSQMSLTQMVGFLRRALEPKGADRFQPPTTGTLSSPKLKRHLHYRAMRALDMLDKFPDFAKTTTDPMVLCIGSSGFMRGICPATIEATAQQAGHRVRAGNLGMAMLSVDGITEVCEFLRSTMQDLDRRIDHAVIEMEIMQLSILPPAGDIEIMEAFKAGAFRDVPRKYYDADTIWEADSGGAIAASETPEAVVSQANWERNRNREIRDAFDGQIKMDSRAVASWIRGVKALQQVSNHVTAVIHPIQSSGAKAAPAQHGPNHVRDLIAQVTRETGVEIRLDTDFDMADEDFKNISHMNDHRGRQTFSAQITRHLFKFKPDTAGHTGEH